MAKINQQKITFTLSKLVRDNDEETLILDDEMIAALFQAIQQMVGSETLIEIE